MPKSRTRSSSTKDIAASSSSNPSLPSKQSSITQKNDHGPGTSSNQPSLLSTNTKTSISSNPIHKTDLSELSSIVTDLITGKRDETAYQDFLLIFEHFSARALRDDHLEETYYHLIQAAITFIRANQQRFDRTKLEKCYHDRHSLRTNSIQ